MDKTSRRWTKDEDARLLELREQGISATVVAKKLGRTEEAVESRIRLLESHAKGAEPAPTHPSATQKLSHP